MAEFYRKKKKVCPICSKKDIKNAKEEINYKNVDVIRKYVSGDRFKILPRRVTGACAEHQRYLAVQVKYARHMALIPFTK